MWSTVGASSTRATSGVASVGFKEKRTSYGRYDGGWFEPVVGFIEFELGFPADEAGRLIVAEAEGRRRSVH